MWAHNVVGDNEKALLEKIPEISKYPKYTELGNLLQIATIVATLLRIERFLGESDYTALHKSIAEGIAPSVRQVYIPPIQNLAHFLLKTLKRDVGVAPSSLDDIPALTTLLSEDEVRLATAIALWVAQQLKATRPLEESDRGLVAALTPLIYQVNGRLIASMVLADGTSLRKAT